MPIVLDYVLFAGTHSLATAFLLDGKRTDFVIEKNASQVVKTIGEAAARSSRDGGNRGVDDLQGALVQRADQSCRHHDTALADCLDVGTVAQLRVRMLGNSSHD